ncbi:hypothetical protein [Natronococcus sp. A-GB7]|uniref:hypothetical protein n=1 Tax=Natronococcus sp. A-GB7 TaxID=3037649 RepID=UPI00241F1465|nr:hypothetical protein [Natronococcus sp. A-GB7]MDG5821845.1 hypothetical protein [Natronococcus sp. A-GB7]
MFLESFGTIPLKHGSMLSRGTMKRNIERRLNDLEESEAEYPKATLCEIFGYLESWETVDEERNLVRLNGEIMQIPDEILQALAEEP